MQGWKFYLGDLTGIKLLFRNKMDVADTPSYKKRLLDYVKDFSEEEAKLVWEIINGTFVPN